MAQTNTNTRIRSGKTHEGGRALHEAGIASLTRVLNAHMLWEDGFYLNGAKSAHVLAAAVKVAMEVDPLGTGQAIIAARKEHNIRHASLLAAVQYAALGGPDASDLIYNVISRADELAEVLAMAGTKAAPHSVMKGVRKAFGKFDEYQFGKYKGAGKSVSLRDAVFLTHPNPKTVPLVQKIVDATLDIPNTWETRLSEGEDKNHVFTSLLFGNKLGAMALLRNLRNMDEAGVDMKLIADAFEKANWSKVLPFRFLSAAVSAPRYSNLLDKAFRVAVASSDPLSGRTAVLLDTSGSMGAMISQKSTVNLTQAGATLAAAVNGDVDLYQWATECKAVPNWNSLSVAVGIHRGAVGHATRIDQAIKHANSKGDYDRIIIIGDMQFADTGSLKAGQKGYTINLANYSNPGLLFGGWTHLTGFSAATLKYIAGAEA
jgi:60 kDa SS-A/Ro ribonucleoprotein